MVMREKTTKRNSSQLALTSSPYIVIETQSRPSSPSGGFVHLCLYDVSPLYDQMLKTTEGKGSAENMENTENAEKAEDRESPSKFPFLGVLCALRGQIQEGTT